MGSTCCCLRTAWFTSKQKLLVPISSSQALWLGYFQFYRQYPQSQSQSGRAVSCVCCPCIMWQQDRGWFLEQTSLLRKREGDLNNQCIFNSLFNWIISLHAGEALQTMPTAQTHTEIGHPRAPTHLSWQNPNPAGKTHHTPGAICLPCHSRQTLASTTALNWKVILNLPQYLTVGTVLNRGLPPHSRGHSKQ